MPCSSQMTCGAVCGALRSLRMNASDKPVVMLEGIWPEWMASPVSVERDVMCNVYEERDFASPRRYTVEGVVKTLP